MTAKRRTRSVVAVAVLTAAAAAVWIGGEQNAGAFGGHEQITRDAFAPGPFLRRGVLEVINDQHAFMDRDSVGIGDSFPNSAEDFRHFDDCEFDATTGYINRRYDEIQDGLSAHLPFYAALNFGRALHPAQDLYAHSNWVEIGFPLADDPETSQVEGGATQADLIDLSGAQRSLAQRWFAPAGGEIVRRAAPLRAPFGAWDVLLGHDDWVFPGAWEIESSGRSGDPGGQVLYVPTLIDPQGVTRGKLLITGRGSNDHDCNVISNENGTVTEEFVGPKHGDKTFGMNKDHPDNGRGRGVLYHPARALAMLQTAYEWCRAVREAALARPEPQDGLLVATWVKAGANPHPANTPCAPARRGPKEVVVTIVSVEVRHSSDDGRGQIQLAATLYDSPRSFRRSVHVTNTSRRSMRLGDGDRVPRTQLPDPMRLCVGTGASATLAVHAWDNDGSQAGFEHAYDESDDLLLGVQRRLARDHRTQVITATGRDLIVRYRIGRQDDTIAAPACVGVAQPGAGG
jgi:hypothetical protein